MTNAKYYFAVTTLLIVLAFTLKIAPAFLRYRTSCA